MALEIIILAAGKGKRMHSALPKVLHKVANKPMLQHVIETANALSPKSINVVVGHMGQMVEQMLDTLPEDLKKLIKVVYQNEQLGTGHAVNCAMPNIDEQSDVLVLYGDTPLTPVDLLKDLVNQLGQKALCVLSAITDKPTGYGRIVRNGDFLKAIVEEKDASAEEKKITEINTGNHNTVKTPVFCVLQIGHFIFSCFTAIDKCYIITSLLRCPLKTVQYISKIVMCQTALRLIRKQHTQIPGSVRFERFGG